MDAACVCPAEEQGGEEKQQLRKEDRGTTRKRRKRERVNQGEGQLLLGENQRLSQEMEEKRRELEQKIIGEQDFILEEQRRRGRQDRRRQEEEGVLRNIVWMPFEMIISRAYNELTRPAGPTYNMRYSKGNSLGNSLSPMFFISCIIILGLSYDCLVVFSAIVFLCLIVKFIKGFWFLKGFGFVQYCISKKQKSCV